MLVVKEKLEQSLALLKKYEWLLDAYVLDFYLDDHWNKLPDVWQQHLENIPMEYLSELLQNEDQDHQVKWPVELMVLQQELRKLCINRAPKNQHKNSLPCSLLNHPKLKYMFQKRVKPKKQHEITRMAEICALSHRQTPVDFIVDFGAGVGHLARILGYGYGLQVCCFEMQPDLNQKATEIDLKLESMAAKHLSQAETSHFQRPVHLTQRLESSTQPAQFLSSIRNALQLEDDKFSFGIIGLHPCGNLGPTLMRMFLGCPQAKFLNFVGCCYQKMTTQDTHSREQVHGYPLSKFLSEQVGNYLSYEAREISCHAMEVYHDRLLAKDYEHLRIHSFRAAAERIIVQQFPDLRHCALRNVKHSPDMTFHQKPFKELALKLWTAGY
ncbi:protein RRNAD1 isoform X2 [Drosophila eugracilis]|uniref:protein RRNAD1 isoform X2 n=1 Tax=Drosophila eugracilis TaxID=29029 RepID=UPI0007E6CE3D|nr:protein RRNAD1 isoform X2 [Drosophila eugracilis]